MIKKRCLLFLLFVVYGLQSFMPCQGALTGQALIDLIATPNITKEEVLQKVRTIKVGSQEARTLLTWSQDAGFDSKSHLIEYILFDIIPNVSTLQARIHTTNPGARCLSADDLLEISKSLWNLDSTTASSLQGCVRSRQAGLGPTACIDKAPLIYRLIYEYINNRNHAELYKKFIDFIIKDHPGTLKVTNEQGDTVLHLLHKDVNVIADSPLTKSLVEDFIKAGVPIDAQNERGYTALYEAAIYKDDSYVQKLLEHKANPFLKNCDVIKEMMEMCSEYQPTKSSIKYIASLCLLVEHCKDKNEYLTSLRTEKQETILHIATEAASQRLINALIAKGINSSDPVLNQKDSTNKTPRDYVQALTDTATRDAIVSLLDASASNTNRLHQSAIRANDTEDRSSSNVRPSLPGSSQQQKSSSSSPVITQGKAGDYIPLVIGGAALAALIIGGIVWSRGKLNKNASGVDDSGLKN